MRRKEFEQVYSAGSRYSTPLFSALVLKNESAATRVGFAVSKRLGSAVQRNRFKRRLREAVRLHLPEIGPGWSIVFHPRRAVLETDFGRLRQEVVRLFRTVARQGSPR